MRPPIWQLIRNAIQHFKEENDISYSDLKKHILKSYPNLNDTTLTCQIIICSVNHPSRIHYPENKKPRESTSQYDFLYNTGRGRLTLYNPSKHGIWIIDKTEDGSLSVRRKQDSNDSATENIDNQATDTFALESHLRDYLAKNISHNMDFGVSLNVYTSTEGIDGVEYQTDVGPIDILATSPEGDFYVFELKLSKGPDAALGQVLRYMGWVKKHMAKNKNVQGVILASEISEKLRYAVLNTPNVKLLEYKLHFIVKPVALME